MTKLIKLIILILIIISFTKPDLLACTIIKATKSGVTFVGNNEDGTDPITYLWFLPPEKGKYGRVYFTLSDKWPQGGMNDQGLFYDGTACPLLEVKKSLNKPEYRGNLSEKILEECATVDEAIALLKKYNLRYFRNGQMLLTDRAGHSAIIEGDTIIYPTHSYQIATNYYQSNPSLGGYPCHRYDIAESMLKKTKTLSVDSFRSIMEAVHLEGYSFTQYSTIHDLNNLIIYYFADSDFQHAVKIDLKEELKKGENWHETEEFFRNNGVTEIQRVKAHSFNGQLTDRYENGQIRSQLNFLNGKINGFCTRFYFNGKKAWSASYKQGDLTGVLEYWKDSGKPILTYEFYDDAQTNIIDYYPSGQKLLKLTLINTDHDIIKLKNIIAWNENGELSYQGRYQNGLFYLNKSSTVFTGKLSTYYTNGQTHMLRRFEKGKKHGKNITWDRSGMVKKEEHYRDGILLKINRH